MEQGMATFHSPGNKVTSTVGQWGPMSLMGDMSSGNPKGADTRSEDPMFTALLQNISL
ncbi:unnamed protein product [Musa acuminata subsp. burmannicoides]